LTRLHVTTSELLVVPGDRHVERLARQGERAETRTSLRARLAAANAASFLR
jgi:hypothetical protein